MSHELAFALFARDDDDDNLTFSFPLALLSVCCRRTRSQKKQMSGVKIGLEWETLVELPKERTDYAMVAIGWDRIAIVGGWVVRHNALRSCWYGIYKQRSGRHTK